MKFSVDHVCKETEVGEWGGEGAGQEALKERKQKSIEIKGLETDVRGVEIKEGKDITFKTG